MGRSALIDKAENKDTAPVLTPAQWNDIWCKLQLYAWRCLKNLHDLHSIDLAEVAEEAITRYLAGEEKKASEIDVFSYLCQSVRKIASDKYQRSAKTSLVSLAESAGKSDSSNSPVPQLQYSNEIEQAAPFDPQRERIRFLSYSRAVAELAAMKAEYKPMSEELRSRISQRYAAELAEVDSAAASFVTRYAEGDYTELTLRDAHVGFNVDQQRATQISWITPIDNARKAIQKVDETKLIERAKTAISPELMSRLKELEGKRDSNLLKDAETEELLALSDRVEEIHSERLEALADLAKLRGTTLAEIMDQLGIRFPHDA